MERYKPDTKEVKGAKRRSYVDGKIYERGKHRQIKGRTISIKGNKIDEIKKQ